METTMPTSTASKKNDMKTAGNDTYPFALRCEGCLSIGVPHESRKETFPSPSTDLEVGTTKKEKIIRFTNCQIELNTDMQLGTKLQRGGTCWVVFNLPRCYACA